MSPVGTSDEARPMGAREAQDDRRLAVAIYVALGAWAATLIVAGGWQLDASWGGTALGAGILTAIVIGVAAWLGSFLAAVYGSLVVLAGGMIVAGAVTSSAITVGLGLAALAVTGATAPVAWMLRDIRDGLGAGRRPRGADRWLQEISQNTMLSDHAKRVLFRERELALLRGAIEEHIQQGEYQAALTLCDAVSDLFGRREEAEEFRTRVMQVGQERHEAEVQAALGTFDDLLATRDWGAIHREAARMRRLYGDSHLLQDLDHRILRAREEHKRELEQQFLEAAGREDVESAMDLLKSLDRYLSPEEGERLAEVAQGVVVKHRENLGVQFKLAVNDHRWGEAARIGAVIISEFPNSKMAEEVGSMIDVLRTRAAEGALSSEGAP